MADLYVYKSKFDPILLPNETAHLITQQKEVDVECMAMGAMPYMEYDFGALAAATWSNDNDVGGASQYLKMNDWDMIQMRMLVLDDIRIKLSNLGSVKQWRSANWEWWLPQFPGDPLEQDLREWYFKASEFFVYEDDLPKFHLYSVNACATSRVAFLGYRFRFRRIGARGRLPIWVSGWPGSNG